MSKALVTGASGFIGSTLIDVLARRGIEVHAMMRRTSSDANLAGANFRRVEGDLGDAASLKRAVEGVDYVFHLAGVVAARNREEYFRHNAGGTQRLADAVAEMNPGLKRFVFVSSIAAGGPAPTREPRTEELADQPVSAYGQSKLEAERLLLSHRERFPISIVRPPIVYGPRDKAVFTVVKSVSRNILALPAAATEDGHKYYSHIHCSDLVDGIVQAGLVEGQVGSGEVFYLSSDDVVTYEQMMLTMARHLGLSRPFKIRVPRIAVRVAGASMSALGAVTGRSYPLNLDKVNEILPDYWICSNAKAKRLLGFSPRHDLQTGLEDTIRWYKENRWL